MAKLSPEKLVEVLDHVIEFTKTGGDPSVKIPTTYTNVRPAVKYACILAKVGDPSAVRNQLSAEARKIGANTALWRRGIRGLDLDAASRLRTALASNQSVQEAQDDRPTFFSTESDGALAVTVKVAAKLMRLDLSSFTTARLGGLLPAAKCSLTLSSGVTRKVLVFEVSWLALVYSARSSMSFTSAMQKLPKEHQKMFRNSAELMRAGKFEVVDRLEDLPEEILRSFDIKGAVPDDTSEPAPQSTEQPQEATVVTGSSPSTLKDAVEKHLLDPNAGKGLKIVSALQRLHTEHQLRENAIEGLRARAGNTGNSSLDIAQARMDKLEGLIEQVIKDQAKDRKVLQEIIGELGGNASAYYKD